METSTPKKRGCLKTGLIGFVALFVLFYVVGLLLPDPQTVQEAPTKFSPTDSIAIAKMYAEKAAEAEQDSIKKSENAAKAKKLLSGLTPKRDDFKSTTFYYGSKQPYANVNQLYLYLGVDDDPKYIPGLRMKIQYAGDDWIFWTKAEALVDGNKMQLGGMGTIDRDNESGKVWETTDSSINPDGMNGINNLMVIRAIAESDKAVLRLSGKRTKDRTITSSEKRAIKKVLAAYDALVD